MKARNLLFAASFVFAMTQASHGADATWTGLGADSAWTTTGNWSTSPVPGAGDTATFNSDGNGKTTITIAPASLTKYVFDTGASAYTISGSSTTWSVPNGGGVTINSGVTTSQNLSGIQFLRPAVNSTVNFDNQGSGTLTLGTMFTQNAGTGTTQTVLKFTPGADGTIEIASGKLVDNAGTGGSKKISVLLDDDGILKMAATGTFDGTDSEGNSVTIHRGTYMANSIAVIGTARTSLGANGRIQFGETGQTRTATLDYYNAANATTDRAFYIIDNNTAVFKVSGGSSTNLAITSAITQSGSAGGGGKLTKDGAGILTLSGANTFTGDTAINNGKIALGNALALQYSAYDTTGSTSSIGLDVTGYATPTLGGLKGSVDLATAITGYGSVTSLTLNPQSGKSATYSGIISDGDGSMTLIKSGAGMQVLSGNNSFTGNVTVDAGTLRLTHDNALGTGTKTLFSQGGSRIVELSGGITLGSNITLTMSSNSSDGSGLSSIDGNNTINGKINVSFGNPILNISSSAGSTLTLSGDVQLVESSRPLTFGGASTNDNTVNGDISSNDVAKVLSVNKQGAGKWIFNGTNTYTGTTSVTGGTLVINGDNSGASGAVSVSNADTRLAGDGTIGGNTTINNAAIHSPGNSPGVQKFTGDLTYADGSIFEWDIDRTQTQTRGAGYDAVNVTGTLTGSDGADAGSDFDAKFRIVITDADFSNSFWDTNKTWADIFTSADGTTAKSNWTDIFGGGFQYYHNNGSTLTSIDEPDAGTVGYFTLSGSSLTWTAVPEPTSALAGLLLTAGLLRRRRA